MVTVIVIPSGYLAALTLPWKSTLTCVADPPLLALPRHTPLSSFFKIADVGVASFFNFRFGLAFGEAVAPGNRRVRVVLAGAIDGVVVRARLCGRVLCGGGCGHGKTGANHQKRSSHFVSLKLIVLRQPSETK